MNGIRRIAANTLTLSVSNVLSKLVLFLVFTYIARTLGDVSFGKFNFAYSFAIVASMAMDFGINYMIIREISRHKDKTNQYFFNGFIVKLLLSSFLFLIIFFIVKALNKDFGTVILVYLLSFFSFVRSFNELFFSVFKAHERMYYEAMIRILNLILLSFGSLIVFIFFNANLFLIAFVFALSEIICFFINLFVSKNKFFNIKWNFNINVSKEIIRKALPFALSMISASIYFHISTLVLSILKGDSAVGIFSAPFNLIVAIMFIPGMYTFALYPIFSRDFNKFKKKVHFIYERSFSYLCFMGLPISIGSFVLARKIIFFIYGTEFFNESVIVMKILCWFIFIKFLGYLTGIILSSINKQKQRMYAQAAAAIVSVLLNIILIPRLSFIGAAIAMLSSEIVLFCLTYFFSSKFFLKINIFKNIYKPLFASIIMGIIIKFLNLNLLFSIISGIIIYFALLLMIKAFDNSDFKLLRKILKK